MRILLLILGLIAAAVVATFVRYQSLHPCDWLEKDMTAASEMPEIWVIARLRARFLVEGITDPGVLDCIEGWWSFRIEELEKLNGQGE
jgi:hypothetical protein